MEYGTLAGIFVDGMLTGSNSMHPLIIFIILVFGVLIVAIILLNSH